MSLQPYGVAQQIRRLVTAAESRGVDSEIRSAALPLIVRINEVLEYAAGLLRAGLREDALSLVDGDAGLLACLGDLEALQRVLDSSASGPLRGESPLQPRFLSEIAWELVAARDVQRRLAPLLRTHRLLAIGGGSLEMRVATLRKLLDGDPDHRGWLADLNEYEKALRAKLSAELVEALEASSGTVSLQQLDRAKSIIATLAESTWQQPLTGREIRGVQQALAGMREAWARSELTQIVALVTGMAPDGLSSAQTAELHARWALIKEEWPAIDRDPTARTLKDWLNDHHAGIAAAAAREAVEVAIAKLRAALRDGPMAFTGRPADEYRRLSELVVQLDRVEPEGGETPGAGELRREAVCRQKTLRTAILVRRALIGGVLLIAATIMSAGVWLAVARARDARAIGEVIVMMERTLEQRGPHDAADAWEGQVAADPRLVAHPFAARLRDSLDAAVEDAQRIDSSCRGRADAIRERLAEVQTHEVAASVLAAIDPDSVTQAASRLERASRALESLDREVSALEKDAARLPRLVGERGAEGLAALVRDLRQQVANAVGLLKVAESDVRGLILSDVERRLVSVASEQAMPGEPEAMLDTVGAVLDSGEPFLGGHAEDLRARVSELRGDRSRARVTEALHRRLSAESSSGVDAHVAELLRQRDSLKDHVAGVVAAIDDVARMVPSYRAVEAWSTVSRQWAPVRGIPRGEAAALAAAIVKAMESPVQPADGTAWQPRLSRLVACLEQQASGPPKHLIDLLAYLERPIMRRGVQVTVHDGRNYYVPAGTAYGYFTDEDKVQPLSATTEFLKAGPRHAAPHAELAGMLREQLSAAENPGENVDDALAASIAMVGSTEKSVEEVDPVLRCRLMMALLATARTRVLYDRVAAELVARSDVIRQEVGRSPAWVKSAEVTDQSAWKATRERARRVLPLRDEVDRITAEPAAYAAVLEKRPPYCKTIELFGWVDLQQTECRVRAFRTPEVDATGTLLAVRLDGENTWRFMRLGEVRGGEVRVDGTEGAMFGEPVWLEKEL